MLDGMLLVTDGILTIRKLKASRLSIERSKARKVTWLSLCSYFILVMLDIFQQKPY